MLYIPEEWLINKDNMEEVHKILKELDIDIVVEDKEEVVINNLRAIGETKIIENLDKIPFGA